jgi:hypothetical protein
MASSQSSSCPGWIIFPFLQGYNGRIEYVGRAGCLAYGDRIPQASEQSERIMHVTQWLQRWTTTRRRTRRPRYLGMAPIECLLLGALLFLGLWQASHAEHAASLRWMQRRSFSVTPCSSYPPSPCMRRRMGRPTGAVRLIRQGAARMFPPARRRAVSFTR